MVRGAIGQSISGNGVAVGLSNRTIKTVADSEIVFKHSGQVTQSHNIIGIVTNCSCTCMAIPLIFVEGVLGTIAMVNVPVNNENTKKL